MNLFEFYISGEYAFTFRTDKTIIQLGRSPECDLFFEDPALSRVHAILRKREGEWELEDASKNGLRREGDATRWSGRSMEMGEFYELGKKVKFRFLEKIRLSSEPTLLLKERATQVLEVQKDRMVLGEGRLEYRDEHGKPNSRFIPAEGLSIGSHKSNDLVLEGETISQFHAHIQLKKDSFVLSDLNSTNGTYLNGLRINEVPLVEESEIRLGAVSLRFQIARDEVRILPKNTSQFCGLITKSLAMKRLFSKVEIVASTEAPVAIYGETGTGKELLSQSIHELSRRQRGPFIPLNCAALPADLIESELFGYEKGAFTGALQTKEGAFEAADNGTLFLDEIGEMPLEVQSKLLRVLESGEVKRLGSNQLRKVNVRVVSATHRKLASLVQENKFREDLYFRLQVIPLEIPPLRDRIQDLYVLCPYLLKKIGFEQYSLEPPTFRLLENYGFPGNVRELKNLLQRACIEAQTRNQTKDLESRKLLPEDFKFVRIEEKENINPEDEDQRSVLIQLLRKNKFNQSRVARELNVPISTLHDRIRRLKIALPKRHVA